MKGFNNIKQKGVFTFIILSFIFSVGLAQDGAKLFKQNCGACHKVDKNNIGPMLKGSKAKWDDAGEGELIYEWVSDPTELYNSGKSQMAQDVWEFNPSTMTAMSHLSKEDIDAIFIYVDSPEAIAPSVEEGSVPVKEDNNDAESTLNLFETTILLIVALFLIITIQIIRKAIYALSGQNEIDLEQSSKDTISLSKALTGAVDIEEEESILMDHDYDGIKELDNDLPPWWVWMFYTTIVFGVIYVMVYHVFDTAPLQIEAYEIEMVEAAKEVEAYKLSAGMAIDETNVELLTDDASLEHGKTIFAENCVVCHGTNGEGASGPNLTDDYWMYGGGVEKIFTTVKYGTNKGMPEHESKLNPIELQMVVSYVKSLPFTKGKEPEGEKEE